MFRIDDLVVYGKNGVCKITDIGSVAVADPNKEYYTLKPVYSVQSVIYAPVENGKITMRPVILQEEANSLIESIPKVYDIEVINEKERENIYKSVLVSCDCERLVSMIKTIHHRKNARIMEGKKVTVVDDKYGRMAGEQLYGELAYALGIDRNEVEERINKILESE